MVTGRSQCRGVTSNFSLNYDNPVIRSRQLGRDTKAHVAGTDDYDMAFTTNGYAAL